MANDNTNIQTDANLSPSTGRMRLGAVSAPSLSSVNGYILEEARKELRFPQSIRLFKQMLLDPNVASAYSVIELFLSRVDWRIETPKDASPEELKRCEQLNYNLQVMNRPWQEYIVEILSYIIFGFATPEKVYQELKDTPVGDFIGWKDLRMISQDTVGQWFFDSKSGDLKGLRQDLSQINRDGRIMLSQTSDGSKVDLARKKFMLFRHSPKRDNPEGISPLRSCYTSWKYRSIVEEYEGVGVSKDLGGTPVLGVDVSIINAAEEDPASWQASLLNEMKAMAANLHAGEQTYAIVPKAYDENNNPLFDLTFQGVQGGGKQYDTDTIVRRHDTKILMTFFADVLKLGTDSHGSFSLADSKTSLLMMGVESHLKNIQRTLNHDLMKQTYELNKWDYDPRTSCRFVYGDIEKQDLDTLSSAVSRIFAVGAVRPTDDIEDHLREELFGLAPVKEADPEILETESTSRSGDGHKTSGEGTAKNVSGGDSSVQNKENKA
jgi:hypothetical protein